MNAHLRGMVLSVLLAIVIGHVSVAAITTRERAIFYSARPDKWASADSLDPLPGWAYEPMVKGLLRDLRRTHTVTELKVRLLAWSTQEDTRPLLVDSAVLWATFDSENGQKWVLSHRFRHPRDLLEWWDATPDDVDWSATVILNRAPTNADVYELLSPDRLQYSFFGLFGPDYTVHMAGVREKTWLAVIGEPPTKFFK